MVRLLPARPATYLWLSALAFSIHHFAMRASGQSSELTSRSMETNLVYLCAFACLVMAVLTLPQFPRARASGLRIQVGGFMTATAAAAPLWYFLVGPWILQSHESSMERLVVGAIPVLELAVIFRLLLLLPDSGAKGFRPLMTVLIPAVGMIIVAGGLMDAQAVHSLPSVPLNILSGLQWFGVALLIVGGQMARHVSDATTDSGTVLTTRLKPAVWQYLLPYALTAPMVAFMVYATTSSSQTLPLFGVYVAGAILVELLFAHQYLVYRELISFTTRSTRLENLAAIDPITELPNHRTTVAALDQELARCRRHERPCTLLFLDLDHFKMLNDAFGHPAGDAALHEFADVVREALRNIDILGRWGGEEFVALLPETEIDEALMVAERVRSAVATHKFSAVGAGHMTCSVGIAACPDDGDDRDTIIAVADRAMYEAKRLGRNQVRASSEASPRHKFRARTREETALDGIIEALLGLLEVGDRAAIQRAQAVSKLAGRLAISLGLDRSEVRMLELAGRLLDIGNVTMPDALRQKLGPLDADDWAMVRTHTVVAATVVSRIPALRVVAPAVRAHHERWDGQGYPDRLQAEETPRGGRILAVADSYLAMLTDRPSRAAMRPGDALEELKRCAGTQFDPDIVACLERAIHTDPAVADIVSSMWSSDWSSPHQCSAG